MKKKRKSQVSQPSIEVLLKQGEAHLGAGRYRDAIVVYKQLLKREQRLEWQDALADAYLARAEQLAAKGMYQEAVALWENMSGVCATRRRVDLYIAWLCRAGRYIRGARVFAEADEAFRQSPAGERLAGLLAGLLASGQSEIAETLPADTALVQQHASVAAAMHAYCQGDDVTLKEHLRRIPFRSPYRDLRLILQALSLLETDPPAARSLLDKVTDDSPLACLATAGRTATLDADRLLEAVAGLDPVAREFVFTLRGWDAEQVKLIGELQALGQKQAPPKALFKFVSANSGLWGTLPAQGFCLALLPDYPEGLDAYERQFGALSPVERERLSALAAERRGNLTQAATHWLHCVHHLTHAGPRGDDALKAALILRHLAGLMTRLYGPDPWNEQVLEHLSRSLELDPVDKETYLRLMEMARLRDDRKDHDHWVEQAVHYFPQDADILMAAAMGAYHRGAFKKAARFAQTLLDRDPINHPARNMLISCHLAHARKQVTAGRHAPAGKELDAALALARDDDQYGVVELNQGLLALLTGAEETGMALLRQAYRHLGGGMIAHLRFLVDGQRLGFDPRIVGKHYTRIRDTHEAQVTEKDILRLVDLLHRYSNDGVKGIDRILERLRGPLKTAAKLDYSEKEMQAICAALQRVGHHLLLKDYAEAGLKRWGQRPAFVYYRIFGRTKGRSDRMTPIENIELQTALDRAIEEEEHETVAHIEDFLGLPSFGPGGTPPLPLDLVQGLGGMLEEIMDELGTDDLEEVLDFLEERMRKAGLPVPPRPKGRRP